MAIAPFRLISAYTVASIVELSFDLAFAYCTFVWDFWRQWCYLIHPFSWSQWPNTHKIATWFTEYVRPIRQRRESGVNCELTQHFVVSEQGPASFGYTMYVLTERLSLLGPIWVMLWVLKCGTVVSRLLRDVSPRNADFYPLRRSKIWTIHKIEELRFQFSERQEALEAWIVRPNGITVRFHACAWAFSFVTLPRLIFVACILDTLSNFDINGVFEDNSTEASTLLVTSSQSAYKTYSWCRAVCVRVHRCAPYY